MESARSCIALGRINNTHCDIYLFAIECWLILKDLVADDHIQEQRNKLFVLHAQRRTQLHKFLSDAQALHTQVLGF